MRQPLKVGIVGCGKVAATHADAFHSLPGVELAAVCDANAERAAAFASRYSARPYPDLEQMLGAERLNAVALCTPHKLHAEGIETAARHGVHVLCEKPLATGLMSCDRAIAAARGAGIKLAVVSQRRWYEPVERLKHAIDTGKIGIPVIAQVVVLGWRDEAYYKSDPWRGTWAGEGGGVMVSQTTHQLDLLLWLMGPIEELYGYWDTYNHPYIEVEDSAAAVIRFANGGMGTLLVSNSQNPGLYGKIRIHGSNGASIGAQVESGSPFIAGVTERADPPFIDLWTVPGEEHLIEEWKAQDTSLPLDVMTHYHKLQIEDFVNAIREDREPRVNGEAGRAVVELFSAVYWSERHRKPVRFPLSSALRQGVQYAKSS